MKRKSIILLSSILAGSLLVGGAFAAYAVTDNADPFGFVATPGTYEEEGTNYVTLEFGSTSALANLENVEAGKDYRAGIVSLKSSMNYTGDFTVRLVDRTERASTDTNKKLIDYITVGVYEGNVTPVAPATLPDAGLLRGSVGYGITGHATTNTFALPGTAAGKEYSVFLSVSGDVGIYFSQMANDKVYVEVDWAPKAGDESTSYPVYFERPSAWGTLNPKAYVYAWVDTPTHKENAVFPGVEMTHVRDGIYSAQIPNNLTSLVFSAGDNNEDHKTPDISKTGYDPANASYLSYSTTSSKWEWGELPEEQVLDDNYSFTIAGGDPIAMIENEETDKTDGRLAEFEKTGNAVTIGQQLAFKASETVIGSSYIGYEGNVTSDGKIKISGSVDVFIKIYKGTGEQTGHLVYRVYVSYPANALYFVNSAGWSNLQFYAWTDEPTKKNADFPGIPLDTYIGVNEFEQSKYAFDFTGYEKIIISSGDPAVAQTVDIPVSSFTSDVVGFYLTGEQDGSGNYKVGFITVTPNP